MDFKRLNNLIVILLLINVEVLVLLIAPHAAERPAAPHAAPAVAGNPTVQAPHETNGTQNGTGIMPPQPSPGAAPVSAALAPQPVQPSGTPPPSRMEDMPMHEVYWALPRLADRESSRYTETQAKQLAAALKTMTGEEDKDRRKVLECLSPGQASALLMWHQLGMTWPTVAQKAMFSTAGDAVAFFEAPLPPPTPDMGSDGPGQPRLAVPYYQLLWGVAALDRESKLPCNAKQAKFIADTVEELLGVFSHLQIMYTSAVEVAHKTLRADQLAYIEKHPVQIENYSLQFAGLIPKDADVVGYIAVHLMANRAKASLHDLPQAKILDIPVNPSPSSEKKPDPEFYFAGVLMLDDVPALALDREQCLALMPYVKGVADENYHSHMVKEQISDVLSREQRIWILQYLRDHGATPPNPMVGPGDVIRQMRERLQQAQATPSGGPQQP